MNPISFFVSGIPKTAGSKRAFIPKGWNRAVIVEDCKKSKDWRGDIKSVAVEKCHAPLEGPVELTLRFELPRPKGHFGSGKNASVVKPASPQRPAVKPDVLKLARAVEDALTGLAWKDDAQIVDEHLHKCYSDNGKIGVTITITPIV